MARLLSVRNRRSAPTLLQASVDLDFAYRAEVHASIDHHWDHETGGHCGTIALAVLLRSVDGLIYFARVKCVKYGRPTNAIPCLGRDSPHDRIFVAICRDRRG